MRIQVLNLPGGVDDYPFALILDEVSDIDPATAGGLKDFKDCCEARAILVTAQTVEVLL